MKLYRPTGQLELERLFETGLRAWPPRLPEQPIFYPVLNQDYAEQIARAWNTREERRVGYVTRFDVHQAAAARYERRVVGASVHEELWVPAEDLPLFNFHIEGRIELVNAFFGPDFEGHLPRHGALAGLNADDQLDVIGTMALHEIEAAAREYPVLFFLHFPYWRLAPNRQDALEAIRTAWNRTQPGISLLENSCQTA